MQPGSGVAVAVMKAGSSSSNLTPAGEFPCAAGAALKTKEKKKKKSIACSFINSQKLFPFCTTREAIISYIPQLKQQIATD